MTKSIVYEKSFTFALRIIKLHKYLIAEKKEFILSKQVLSSGTSIGANIKEGLQAQSNKDFLSKMNIALKEASETEYWIELLIQSDYVSKKDGSSILSDCFEIIKLLSSIVKTTKKHIKNS